METCDVLIAGGGPAGSTRAWALLQVGLDVLVIDRAIVPRDKACGGWITPQVLSNLPLDAEEIRPAIESGLIATTTIIEAHSRYSCDQLRPYEEHLRERFGIRQGSSFLSQFLPRQLGRTLGPWLLRTSWFVRHVLLSRWFLHAHGRALALA